MKLLVGLVLGLFSGFLIYMACALMISVPPSGVFIVVTFLGGWAISTYFLVRDASSVSRDFSRGFLLGAAEWFAMLPIGFIFVGKAVSNTVGEVDGGSEAGAVVAGAMIGGGLMSIITGTLSIVMTFVCLLGFLISHQLGRAMKQEISAETKTCPDCAELIQAAATKCKHCGASTP